MIEDAKDAALNMIKAIHIEYKSSNQKRCVECGHAYPCPSVQIAEGALADDTEGVKHLFERYGVNI